MQATPGRECGAFARPLARRVEVSMSGSTLSSRVSEPAAPAAPTHEPQIAPHRDRPVETRGAHWQRKARRWRLRLVGLLGVAPARTAPAGHAAGSPGPNPRQGGGHASVDAAHARCDQGGPRPPPRVSRDASASPPPRERDGAPADRGGDRRPRAPGQPGPRGGQPLSRRSRPVRPCSRGPVAQRSQGDEAMRGLVEWRRV